MRRIALTVSMTLPEGEGWDIDEHQIQAVEDAVRDIIPDATQVQAGINDPEEN